MTPSSLFSVDIMEYAHSFTLASYTHGSTNIWNACVEAARSAGGQHEENNLQAR
jgi:hypothetical protein